MRGRDEAGSYGAITSPNRCTLRIYTTHGEDERLRVVPIQIPGTLTLRARSDMPSKSSRGEPLSTGQLVKEVYGWQLRVRAQTVEELALPECS